MKWRFVDLDLIDGVLGAAVFDAVMEEVAASRSPDTILFWRPSRPAVYVGYHQLVREDVNIEECAKRGIPVVRRILGGGAGYCDSNQIIYNVIFRVGRRGMPSGPRNVYLAVLSGITEALKILGIMQASIDEERFSVHANGKKISGSGQLTRKGTVNAGGSFLVDFDFEAMKAVLNDPIKNLKKGVKEPEEGMTCLRREKAITDMGEAKAALISGFEKAIGQSDPGELTEKELTLSQELLAKYRSDEWVYRADERRRKKN